jgi:hypothetical protein
LPSDTSFSQTSLAREVRQTTVSTGREKGWVTEDTMGIPTLEIDLFGTRSEVRWFLSPATEVSGLQYIYLLFFVQIVNIMELSPFKCITGSDTFWDGSIPNPLSVGITISVWIGRVTGKTRLSLELRCPRRTRPTFEPIGRL